MNKVLYRAIHDLFQLCAPDMSKVTVIEEKSEKFKTLMSELTNFIGYLSSSDGIISEYEVEFLANYLGVTYSLSDFKKYIEDNNVYSVRFEKEIPQTLKRLVISEAGPLEWNEKKTCDSKAYYEVFSELAKEFIVCDGEVSEQEIEDMNTYLYTLHSYIEENIPDVDFYKSSIDTENIQGGKIVPQFDENGNKIKSLDDLISELNSLVGLKVVKKDVVSLMHLQEIRKIRKERGLKDVPISNHLVFYGNSGTGKTTVARLLAQIYHAMGILSKGQFIEVDRSGLVAGYVGQTALKTQEIINKALGGVLFIDEAYALYSEDKSDYGREAVDTLLKAMEDNRDDLIVIVAGYPELMKKFITSNPGLESRFTKYINFENYTVSELIQIFTFMCNNLGYKCTSPCFQYVTEMFDRKFRHIKDDFANGREIRRFFEASVVNQANRLFDMDNPTNEELCTLELTDVQNILL